MIEGLDPVLQAFLGTLFTWAVTAIGSGLVFLFKGDQRKFLDVSLGFAAGVMMAASYWSLLEPAIQHAKLTGMYGKDGEYSFIPAMVGFLFGALFLVGADKLIPNSDSITDMYNFYMKTNSDQATSAVAWRQNDFNIRKRASPLVKDDVTNDFDLEEVTPRSRVKENKTSWKRILLLIVAITIHNIPEGLAVGVAFGSIGKTPSSTFAKSRSLALGIGIQNFPEGLVVSIPLRASGMSPLTSFWYGQLSGMVEPIFGILGSVGIMVFDPLLPYVLSFAAGAMVFVVFDDIIPEAHNCGNGRMASLWAMVGFVMMMTLDLALS